MFCVKKITHPSYCTVYNVLYCTIYLQICWSHFQLRQNCFMKITSFLRTYNFFAQQKLFGGVSIQGSFSCGKKVLPLDRSGSILYHKIQAWFYATLYFFLNKNNEIAKALTICDALVGNPEE